MSNGIGKPREGSIEQDPKAMQALYDLAEEAYLRLFPAEYEAVRPGEDFNKPWTAQERAAIVPEFLKRLEGTEVYAVYKETYTVGCPAEAGERYSYRIFDLNEDSSIPRAELVGVYATEAEAQKMFKYDN